MKFIAIIGLTLSMVGVLILFRYGMPYRVETGGKVNATYSTTDENARKTDMRYRLLGKGGLACVLAGTGLQVVALMLA